ncbi:TRAP transporter small permease subunit [Butyricicoccus pullicaecorum]|nr:TRAP transporter small permease subunit [Butyricicoccus pullicaecorum]
MKAAKCISKWIDTVNDWIGRICAFAVLSTFGVIICEVVLRRLFHNPQIWTMDMICMTFGCYIILICAYGFQKKAFVAVDVLYARLPTLGQHILHICTYLCFMVPFLFVLVPESWRFFYRAYVSGEKGYSVWAPPTWPVKLCLFIGLVLMCVQGVSEILKHIIAIGELRTSGGASLTESEAKEGC